MALGGSLVVGMFFALGATPSRAALPLPPIGWSQGPSLPTSFSPRWDMSYAYYPTLNQGSVVLFGGGPKDIGESFYNDTYIYSNSTGTWVKGPAAPAGLTARDGSAMAYDTRCPSPRRSMCSA